MTFEATGFGMVWAGRMAGLAGFNSGQEQVTGLGAAQRFFVATHAGKASVSFVVEFCVRHPAASDARFSDVWQNIFACHRGLMYMREFAIWTERKLVALQASLAP
jgi:hypothetical protein